MRLKNWLFAGTSLTILSMAPYGAFAQDAAPELPQVCVDLGFTTLEECAAAQPAGAPPVAEPAPAPEEAAPAPEPEAAPAEEPAPAAEEPAPEPEAAAPEEAAPEPEPAPEPAPEAAPEPAPEPEPAPVEAAPEPEPEAQVQVQAAPEAEPEAPAPEAQAAPEAPAPEAEAAPAPEPQPEPAPEAAPAAEAAPAPEAPVEPAPAAEEQPAATNVAAALTAQVDAHNAAVAELAAGGDAAAAQARIDAALAEIDAICGNAGMPDIDACLAPLGLVLSPIPAAGEAPAEQVPPAVETPAVDPNAPVDPNAAVDPNAPVQPDAVDANGQQVEVVEDLPEGITQEQLAPVLDSAKDAEEAPAAAEGEAAPEQAPIEASARVAPPESDSAAQSEEMRTFAATQAAPLSQEAGTEITATDGSTVNQTVVNNYITNITNNVTNNTQNNTNIGQQNNVTIVEQAPVQQATAGDLITQVILQVGTQLIVNSVGQDTDRFYDPQEDEVFYENLPGGRVREVVSRPDGSQVITVRNRNGDVLRRSRVMPDGREIILASFDDRYDNELLTWRDPGQDLPPLRLNIPVREYVLDASYADENEVQSFFSQPPVEQVTRLYSIDEVKRSARVRDTVRRLEVGNLTFDTGAATISRDQVNALSGVANAMLALLRTNPAETFLIEGHTDAVGSDISNLRLSDVRAATVARILTDFYGVPPENLATQGYGERYLKIRTEAAERENRRVTVRRITPLITVAAN